MYSRVISSNMLESLRRQLWSNYLKKNPIFIHRLFVACPSVAHKLLLQTLSALAEHNSWSAFTLGNFFYEYVMRPAYGIVIPVEIKHHSTRAIEMTMRRWLWHEILSWLFTQVIYFWYTSISITYKSEYICINPSYSTKLAQAAFKEHVVKAH